MSKTMLYLLTISIEVPDEAFHLVDEATKEIQTAVIAIAERLQQGVEINVETATGCTTRTWTTT